MFEREIAVNEFLIGLFGKVVNDIAEETLFQHSVGHGHSPIWLLGHLALVGEFGQKLLGGSMAHPEWMPLFGPGSVDAILESSDLTKSAMVAHMIENYRQLRSMALVASEEVISRPHNVSLLDGTAIVTLGDCLTHLLTSHFNFHLAQLSSCRRAAGLPYLF